MCIQTKIQCYIEQKAKLGTQIAKLKKLENATASVKNLLAGLLADYAQEAPEDLTAIWEEVLAIGSQHNLSVQPLAADELRQWENVNTENERLKQENQQTKRQYLELLETSANRVNELKSELGKERYNYSTLVAIDKVLNQKLEEAEFQITKVRSQMPTPTIRADYELATGNDASELSEAQCHQELEEWNKEVIRPELENLYQEALIETDSEATTRLADEECATAVEEELGLDDDGKDIPALTLWQPWATLIEQEVKHIETRSWPTNYRGPIAIHAAKKTVAISDYPHLFKLVPYGCEFPFGAVVAIANLVNCVEMTEEFIAQQSETELKCGDWKPGRFAWILEIIRPVVPPIPATGGQKIWNWSGTSIEAELEHLEEFTLALPQPLPDVTECEPENLNSIDILKAKGFFQPNDLENYDSKDKYETYRGWDIYHGMPNGGVVSIGLYNTEYNQPWDGSTEYMQDIDPTFPESLADYDEIVAWTRALIDQVENLEVPGQLSLEFPDPTPEQIEEELGCNWEDEEETAPEQDDAQPIESVDPGIQESEIDGRFTTMGLKVEVHLQPPTGLTFRFLNPDDNKLVFSNSLITAEIAGRTWKVCAGDLITIHRERESARLEKIANPYATEEDKFIELVKLSPAVGYIKRRDNGELLSAYAAFANRNTAGEKTVTLAKSRSKKWAEYLHGSFESCGWKVEEPRKINRMVAELGAKQQFAYEIKITGKFSIGQLQKLAEEDFSLLPGEIAVTKTVATTSLTPALTQDYKVKVNSYDLATGTEEEMRSRFEEELKILGGSQMSVSLLTGSEVIESYRISDFQFAQTEAFDAANPKYETTYLPSQKTFKVYKNLGLEGYPATMSGWTNTLYPYTPGFTQRVAAAADAIRRLSKAQNSTK